MERGEAAAVASEVSENGNENEKTMAQKEVLKPFIRSWEGGYCNVAGDRGGATKWGVTLTTYRAVYGQKKTVDDLKRMTEAEWDGIYAKLYWRKWMADTIETQATANLLVDWYWHSGLYGIKLAQKVLGVKIDGLVGQKTLAAINGYADQQELFKKLWLERKAFLERISKGGQRKFLAGWMNRLNGIGWDRLVMANKKKITW